MRDQLPLYVSGRLDDADQSKVEAHLQGCADCAAEVELLRATVRAYDVSPVDAAAIATRIPTAKSARRSRPFHSQPLWRAAAAITLMIAGTATMMVVKREAGGPGLGIDSLALGINSSGQTARETTFVGQVTGPTGANSTISLGNNLSDLTDAQLEALLASLDRIDGAVSADPQALVTPIVPETTAGKNP